MCRCLENSTGGRVEVRGVRFYLWHLRVEVDGLVIHGTEGPGEAPYLTAEKIEVRVGISSFFSHATGAGLRSHVGLKLLRVERPQIHLMVDKDGKTNVPTPKHSTTSKEPVADRLLDLRAREVDLVDGVALVETIARFRSTWRHAIWMWRCVICGLPIATGLRWG